MSSDPELIHFTSEHISCKAAREQSRIRFCALQVEPFLSVGVSVPLQVIAVDCGTASVFRSNPIDIQLTCGSAFTTSRRLHLVWNHRDDASVDIHF